MPTLETIETPKVPVSSTYHGVTVTEDYRWLEDGRDPAVRAWSLKQLEVTRGYLDATAARPKLKARFAELYGNQPVRYYAFAQAGAFFALKRQPPKNQPMLVMMKGANDPASERVLVDPNTIDDSGSTTIDWFQPSPTAASSRRPCPRMAPRTAPCTSADHVG
jgi:prolyl oligopeptidase